MLVIGPGAASFLAAAMLGHRFGVLTPEGDMWQSSLELAFKVGVKDKLAAAVSIRTPVLDMMADRKVTMERILQACKTAMDEKAVDTMVIGCMTMAFLDVAREIEAAIGIPVVNPANVSLKYAEAMVACGLMHSKAAYPLPPKLQTGKVKDFSQLFGTR
jgi:allantoin racemase